MKKGLLATVLIAVVLVGVHAQQQKALTITGINKSNGTPVICGLYQGGIATLYGITTVNNGTAVFSSLIEQPYRPFTGSGHYGVTLLFTAEDITYIYTNGRSLQQLGYYNADSDLHRLTTVFNTLSTSTINIRTANTTLAFNKFTPLL